MAERNFLEISNHLRQSQQQLCVGLDANIERIKAIGSTYPGLEHELRQYNDRLDTNAEYVIAYNRMTIMATRKIAGAFKPNWAFAFEQGPRFFEVLSDTVETIERSCRQMTMRILDAKIGDIGSTNKGYGIFAFDTLNFDAITTHNFMGPEAMKVLTERKDKGIIVLAKTSNDGTEVIQDLPVQVAIEADDTPLMLPYYMHIVDQIAHDWNADKSNLNIGIVAPGTKPGEAGQIRGWVGPDIFLLLPGIGDQGGTPESIVPYALKKGEAGLLSASRSIAFAQRLEGETQTQAIRRAALELHNRTVNIQNAH